jgi:hypothetical protein
MLDKQIPYLTFLVLLGVTLSTSECNTTSNAKETGPFTAQIIIKFTEVIPDPSQPSFVKGLSQDAGISIRYVRPMSGGAHVFRVGESIGEKQLSQALQRLNKRNDIVYAEQDSMMRHQSLSQ